MLTTERSLDIDAPADKVWSVLGRYMKIDEFHPRVSKVEVLSDSTEGLGARRRCHFKDGTSVVEEVVDWQEGRAYKSELTEFALPLKKAVATLAVDPLDGGRSRLTMSMDFQVKYGPLGWLMGKTMMSRMMGGMFLVVLRGLEERVVKGPKAAA